MQINSLHTILQAFTDFDFVDTHFTVPQDYILTTNAPIFDINSNLKPYSDLLKIGHMNSVSLPLHRDEIARVLYKTKFDILGVCETNIKHNTPKDLYNIKGYKLFHVDRNHKNSGGVGIFLNEELANKAKIINVNYKEVQPELIFLEVDVNKVKILIGVVYKSPCIRYGIFSDILEILAYFTTKYDNTVFLGDFNICQLNINSPAYNFFNNNIIKPLSLSQMVKTPTRITKDTCTLLDLILVNSPSSVKFCGNTDLAGISDHTLVYCAYSLKKQNLLLKLLKNGISKLLRKIILILIWRMQHGTQ